MREQRMNVREQIILTDTVLIGKHVLQMTNRPQGWFGNFADAGAAGSFFFMNVRNSSIGIMYNNQDARDQLPYGMHIMSIGVNFFACASASTFTACENKGSSDTARTPYSDEARADPAYALLTNREELHAGIWSADLPNHVNLRLKTNQDIRLEGPVALFSPGVGAVGGGWGWGSPQDAIDMNAGGTPRPMISQELAPPTFGGYAVNLQTVQHGEPDIRRRFPLPIPLDVPKRANLSIELELSQYAKELLKAIPGPYWIPMVNEIGTDTALTKSVKAAMYGIQITVKGERLVQQRGDYSV